VRYVGYRLNYPKTDRQHVDSAIVHVWHLQPVDIPRPHCRLPRVSGEVLGTPDNFAAMLVNGSPCVQRFEDEPCCKPKLTLTLLMEN